MILSANRLSPPMVTRLGMVGRTAKSMRLFALNGPMPKRWRSARRLPVGCSKSLGILLVQFFWVGLLPQSHAARSLPASSACQSLSQCGICRKLRRNGWLSFTDWSPPSPAWSAIIDFPLSFSPVDSKILSVGGNQLIQGEAYRRSGHVRVYCRQGQRLHSTLVGNS
ncbi:hypothetical protein MPLA_760030 [Mesorhizobium sp. ORS 3359]|nr:hypothetical protein MPLA_760030 [Mesorhizobium sp. ORS 3359]